MKQQMHAGKGDTFVHSRTRGQTTVSVYKVMKKLNSEFKIFHSKYNNQNFTSRNNKWAVC